MCRLYCIYIKPFGGGGGGGLPLSTLFATARSDTGIANEMKTPLSMMFTEVASGRGSGRNLMVNSYFQRDTASRATRAGLTFFLTK